MMHPNRKQPRIFYGWWVVVGSTLIMMNTSGILNLGFTAVFEPIAQEFGWSYAQVSLGASLRGLEAGLLVPLVGFLVDRWGTRKLVFIGSVLVTSGLLLLSRISSLEMFYVSFVLVSIGMSACVGTVFLPTVANWFKKKVGLAIGITSAGVGLGGFMVPIITILIDTLHWRTAMIYLALWFTAFNVLIMLLIRHKPEPYGYLPDGEMETTVVDTLEEKNAIRNGESVITARQVLKEAVFWRLAVISMCYSMTTSAVTTHIMPCLSSINISRSLSSMVALVMPLVSTGGRLGAGWLGDKMGRKQVYNASFILLIIGFLFFAFITRGDIWLMVPFIITFSLGWGGTITCRPALLRQYYEKTKFGTILGIADGAMMFGSVIGIPMAGWIFDTWSSYQGAWFGAAVVTIIGLILLVTIPSKYKMTEASPEQSIH